MRPAVGWISLLRGCRISGAAGSGEMRRWTRHGCLPLLPSAASEASFPASAESAFGGSVSLNAIDNAPWSLVLLGDNVAIFDRRVYLHDEPHVVASRSRTGVAAELEADGGRLCAPLEVHS